MERHTTRFDLDLRDPSCVLAGRLPDLLAAGTTWTATAGRRELALDGRVAEVEALPGRVVRLPGAR